MSEFPYIPLVGEISGEKPIEAKVLYNTLKTPLQIGLEKTFFVIGLVISTYQIRAFLKAVVDKIKERLG